MNLHGIAAGAVAAVNPMILGSIQTSLGYVVADDGSQQPKYNPIQVDVPMQVQPLDAGDYRQLDAMNIQGADRKIFINGRVDGIIRPENKGGDIITIPSGVNKGTWLVKTVMEYWPDWCLVAVVLQNGV